MFIWENHVFTLSAGQRYDLVSIEDPLNHGYIHFIDCWDLENPREVAP